MSSVPAETDSHFWSVHIPAGPLGVFLLISQWTLISPMSPRQTSDSCEHEPSSCYSRWKEVPFQPSSEPGCSSRCPQKGWFHPLSLEYWAVTWPVDLGNPWAGQREIVSSSSFKYLGLSLPLVFQGNLLQGLSSSGCLTMREQPMPCVLGWESLAATLNSWVLGRSLAHAHMCGACMCVCVCVCVCVCMCAWEHLIGMF